MKSLKRTASKIKNPKVLFNKSPYVILNEPTAPSKGGPAPKAPPRAPWL